MGKRLERIPGAKLKSIEKFEGKNPSVITKNGQVFHGRLLNFEKEFLVLAVFQNKSISISIKEIQELVYEH